MRLILSILCFSLSAIAFAQTGPQLTKTYCAAGYYGPNQEKLIDRSWVVVIEQQNTEVYDGRLFTDPSFPGYDQYATLDEIPFRVRVFKNAFPTTDPRSLTEIGDTLSSPESAGIRTPQIDTITQGSWSWAGMGFKWNDNNGEHYIGFEINDSWSGDYLLTGIDSKVLFCETQLVPEQGSQAVLNEEVESTNSGVVSY